MACFIQLRDSVPSWISDVNQLSVHVHNKRADFAAEAAKAAAISSPPRRRKSVSSSLASNRTDKSLLQPPSTSHRLKRFLSRESLRIDGSKKRRAASPQPTEEPPSTANSEVVSPSKRMPKHLISYDGHTQKVLEKMVRDIWTAKSSIRSSRIQSTMRTAFSDRMRMQIPTQKFSNESLMSPEKDKTDTDGKADIEIDQSVDESDVMEDNLNMRLFMMKERQRRYMPSTRLSPPVQQQQQQATQTRPKPCPFDFIEGQLDNAQNLCENAAYRFLRHGNCLEEIEGILRAYEFILEASTSMAEKEEKEQAEAAAATAEKKKEARKENAPVTSDNDTLSIEVDDELEVDDEEEAVDTPAMFVAATLKNKDSDLEDSNGGILEVDDRSDTSEVSIDITAFRMTRYGQRTMHPFTVNRVR